MKNNQWCKHNFTCYRENLYANINLQCTLDNPNCRRTEKIVSVELRVEVPRVFFLEQKTKGPENLFEQLEGCD